MKLFQMGKKEDGIKTFEGHGEGITAHAQDKSTKEGPQTSDTNNVCANDERCNDAKFPIHKATSQVVPVGDVSHNPPCCAVPISDDGEKSFFDPSTVTAISSTLVLILLVWNLLFRRKQRRMHIRRMIRKDSRKNLTRAENIVLQLKQRGENILQSKTSQGQSAKEIEAQKHKRKPRTTCWLPIMLLFLQSAVPVTSQTEWPETRETFVHYPSSAEELLSKEMSSIRTPLVLDVVTSVTHWRDPLWDLLKALVHRFRNQNQIIYVRAHMYVGDGLDPDIQCRNVTVDPLTGSRTESPVDSEECQLMCTNGGRYCVPEIPERFPVDSVAPKLLVEETLRRLCIDEVYHASDLKHWEYLENFEREFCFTDPDMAECSKRALMQVSQTDWLELQDCVTGSGGTDGDVVNGKLQEELDRQKGAYSFEDVPMMHIEGIPYQGSFLVGSILDAVCKRYENIYDVTPLACDFCLPCELVRKCLWYLDCDGTPFDVANFNQNQAGSTTGMEQAAPADPTNPPDTMPGGTTETLTTEPPSSEEVANPENVDNTPTDPPATTPPNGATSNISNKEDNDSDPPTSGFFIGGMLAGLIAGVSPAFYFARHEKQTRRAISAALMARETAAADAFRQGNYTDDLEWSAGKQQVTEEDMLDMEDVMLEDVVASVTNQAPTGGKKKKMLKPKMAAGLNKIV